MKSRKYYRSLVREAKRNGLSPIKTLEREIQDLEKALFKERRRATLIEEELAVERQRRERFERDCAWLRMSQTPHANYEQWIARRGLN